MNYKTPKEFEEAVQLLLVLGGYDVRSEMLLGHKRVDLYAEERRLGFPRRVAVECKMHGTPLGQKDFNEIYANYLPLYQSNLIDEILLVTDKGLSPSATTMCLTTRELKHLTYAELESVIMDFGPYLRSLIDEYEQSGLSSYYVPLKTNKGVDLESEILSWLSRPGGTPVAILGSYGMGKTTFARHLTWLLASGKYKNPGGRIPILLSLADISSDQSLAGLLGKAFTAQSVVRNYTFDLFMRLNRAGRFLVILDGFDEMKHCLTWDGFCYNFSQIHRLVQGDAKVMVLGRPNAFLNEEEQRYILHGLQERQGMVFRLADWPDYKELRIGQLTPEQIESFLRGYLTLRQSKKAGAVVDRVLRAIEREQDGNVRGRLRDLAGRPVQLLMLAEVLPQWSGPLNALSVPILYDVFIDSIIEREQRKLVRQGLSTRDRRTFAREIAWWLWTERNTIGLKAEQIPHELVLRHCSSPAEFEGRKRDLVAACFLSRKEGDALYFPHRSFQEFLVAERAVEEMRLDTPRYDLLSRFVTDDIQFFISNMIGVKDLERWEIGLDRYRGVLSWSLSRIWLATPATNKWLVERVERSSNPWYPLFLTAGLLRGETINVSAEILARRLLRRLELAPELRFAMLCVFCLFVLSPTMSENPVERALLTLADRKVVIRETKKNRRRRAESDRESGQVEERTEPLLDSFFRTLEIEPKTGKISFAHSHSFLVLHLREYCFLADWLDGERINTKALSLKGLVHVNPSVLSAIKRRLEL
jgi:NACHT domain/Restriction endonuclease